MKNSLHSEHCRMFLAMLTEAAAKGEAVPTARLAEISRNHTARISNLRAAGHDIRCEDVPDSARAPGEGRQTQYRYIGFTGKNMADVLDTSAYDSLKPSCLSLTRVRDGEEFGLVFRPEAAGKGIVVTLDQPLSLNPGDMLRIERIAAPHKRRLPARIGGLMQCCMATLDEALLTENEGDTLHCRYCTSQMRVRNGAWEWDQKASCA